MWVPSDFAPTLIFLVTGSFVRFVSPRTSSPAVPFLISLVSSVSCSPSSPFWSSTISPGFRLGSTVTSVSNGIGSLSTDLILPVKSSSPTRITAFLAFLVTVGSDVSVTFELTIVRVFSCSPFSPFSSFPSSSVAYFHWPFFRLGSFLTSTSNGISSLTFSVPLVLPPIFTTLFWPASSVSEVTTFFWSLS